MKKQNDSMLWNNIAHALSIRGESKPTGTGWKTRHELAKIWGVTPERASLKVMRAVHSGLAERFEGHQMTDGKLMRCAWYRPKKK